MRRSVRAARCVVAVAQRSQPRARLICLPYAGGGVTAFREWPGGLPDWLEVSAVRLAARESRLAEPADYTLESIVADVATELEQQIAGGTTLPYALFGHSMGALIGFELARELRRRGRPGPTHLFVSGRRAPQVPDPLPRGICDLPRDEFLDRVLALGGIPAQILAEPELIDLLLPALRADFVALAGYRYRDGDRLDCDLHAFTGDRDPIASPDLMDPWAEQTSGRFQTRVLPGDHFFIQAGRDEILGRVAEVMGADLVGVAGQ